jgi:hypothetical protein
MTVAEAGRKGGLSTKEKYGKEHYDKILSKGRKKLKTLIEKGKRAHAENEKKTKERAEYERDKGNDKHSGDQPT